MKKRVILHDNINNKTIICDKEEDGKDHLKAQMTFKSKVFKNKKKYTRKIKYKKKVIE